MKSTIFSQKQSLADTKYLFENRDSKNIILVTDVDGTITTGAGLAGGSKETAAQRTRGGQATLDFFSWLQERGIQWFANSARAQSVSTAASVAQTLYKQLGLKPKDRGCFYVKGKADKYNLPQFWASKHDYKQHVVWTCDNMVSAAPDAGGLAYDKDIAVDYILHEYVKQRPITVVFADDFAGNNLKVLDYFSKHAGKGVSIISVHLLPSNPEAGQQEALALLQKKYSSAPSSGKEEEQDMSLIKAADLQAKSGKLRAVKRKSSVKKASSKLTDAEAMKAGAAAIRKVVADDDEDFPDVDIEPTLSAAEVVASLKQPPQVKRQSSSRKKKAPTKKEKKSETKVVVTVPAPAPSALAVLKAPSAPPVAVVLAPLPAVVQYPVAATRGKKVVKKEEETPASLQEKVQSGEAKVVASTPTVAKVVDLTNDKQYLVPKAALAPPVASPAGPCDEQAAAGAYARIYSHYDKAYIARLKRRLDDLEELWKFGLLHPVHYKEWTDDLRAADAAFGQQIKNFTVAKEYCNPRQVVSLQRQVARGVRSLLHAYERFRTRVLNSGHYLRDLETYCRSIKLESCGATGCAKVQGPCSFSQGSWRPRQPSKAAVDYVRKVSGFNVENDCIGPDFKIVASGATSGPDDIFTAAEMPYADGFLKDYRRRYIEILNLVNDDRQKLFEAGFLSREDNDEQAGLDRKARNEVEKNGSKSFATGLEVVKEQQRMSKAVYPFVHQFRLLREKALHSSSYRKNLARVCKTKQKTKARCDLEPACTYDTKGTWFSGPRGCIIKTKPSTSKHTRLKTVEDCD